MRAARDTTFTIPGAVYSPTTEKGRAYRRHLATTLRGLWGDSAAFRGPVGIRITEYRYRPTNVCARQGTAVLGFRRNQREPCRKGASTLAIADLVVAVGAVIPLWKSLDQVADVRCRKLWCEKGEAAFVEVSVFTLEES